ncbi:sugar-binding domain-containing protein, partial [Leuconostoc falkenbergense]
HFIDLDGKPVNQNLDLRTVSLPLNNLHFKDSGIIVVSDMSKYKMLHLAITKGFVSDVFVDQQTAQRLFDYDTNQ